MSVAAIHEMPDDQKPFVETRKILNSLCGKNNNIQFLRHEALKTIGKDYNTKKKRLILSTDTRAEMMRTEFKTFWGNDKGNFQDEILEIVKKNPTLSPTTIVARSKWQAYFELQTDHGISIENADDIGSSLADNLKELEIDRDPNSVLVATLTKMMAKQNENVLDEIKKVKSEVSNCAKTQDLTGILEQVDEKLKDRLDTLEEGILTQTMQMIEDHVPLNQFSKDDAEKMIADAIDVKLASLNVENRTHAPTIDEILAGGLRDILAGRNYTAAVKENKARGMLRMTIKNRKNPAEGEDRVILYRENAKSKNGFDLDFSAIESSIGAKFRTLENNKPRVSRNQNLVVNITIFNCEYRKMIRFIHDLIRNNYHNKLVHLDIPTPTEFDISRVLESWVSNKIIVDFDNKSYGFIQILVNDGNVNKPAGREYNATCSILNPNNPLALLQLQPVTKLKLRNLATNKYFILNNEVVKRPEELQKLMNNKQIVRVSTHEIVEED